MLFADDQIFLVKFLDYLQISIYKLNYATAGFSIQIYIEKVILKNSIFRDITLCSPLLFKF
jgi:hypothetical protein